MDRHSENPKHAFCGFFERIGDDQRLLPSHVGLVMALFYYHDCGSELACFQASRKKLMRFSRIRSIATYHKCLSELVTYGYVEYRPSWHPEKGSRFRFIMDRKGDENG